ncbi:MAG: thioredoxin domain-containing protein [Thermoflexales bacterium]|nr:thioredoxin domain-containing protein [Thermoflexales bacterium]
MPNHLVNESSPYLRQHAHNPVDWHPWGPEALERARAEDKPIFLSIGYSACHWCHVMAHESFEDGTVAAYLNEHFVCIKVDREERPDLDRIYMAVVQAITGGGGWPMSVFLTPEGKPFFGGTYFPPEPRYGMPGFADVLRAIIDAWEHRRSELLENSDKLVESIRQRTSALANLRPGTLQPETLRSAYQTAHSSFDTAHGGWGSAPKFPQPMTLEFLLHYHSAAGEAEALAMVEKTLEAMARGGIYDQLGGGFHRYSVDEKWLTPHFERMSYDNSQLARVYLHAWQVTGNAFYRTICEEILDYILREMTDGRGGFYATQDADSEGQEGKFFIWTPTELVTSLGGEEATSFMQAYHVTQEGNFEGKTILAFRGSLEERHALAEARQKLLAVREHRVHPGRDEKILTSWNGLMLAAFAEAARVLGRDDYRHAAERNADFLLKDLRAENGRLYHVWNAGEVRINGYLEDYAYLAEGLIELYQVTFAPRWYQAAKSLVDAMIEHFNAPIGFYDTVDDGELLARTCEIQDNATPSGNAAAATVLLKLAGLSTEPRYAELARQSLGQVQEFLAHYPLGFGQWLVALDYALSNPKEIAIVGDPGAADTQALLKIATAGFRPHQIVAVGTGDVVPLLAGRHQIDNRATAYVCTEGTCRLPVTDPQALDLKPAIRSKSLEGNLPESSKLSGR